MGSLIDYPSFPTPTRQSPLVSIANHLDAAAWSARLTAIEDILALIDEDDIPATIARLTDLTTFITASSAETLSNKSFSDTPNFATSISLAGVLLTASATQLNAIVAHLAKLAAITADADEINILDGLITSTTELNALAGVGLTSTELSILDGAVVTTAELNKLSGMTSSTVELNKLTGFIGDVSDLNALQDLIARLEPTGIATVAITTLLSRPPVKYKYFPEVDLDPPLYFTTSVSRNAPFYIISPAAGTIVKFAAILEGHNVTQNVSLQMSIGGVDVSLGLLTLEAAGTVYSVVPTASNVVTENQIITITPIIHIDDDESYINVRITVHILRS
jgi:hypothetical protein